MTPPDNSTLPQAEQPPALALAPGSPLFIPLKREFFEAFERGEKTHEYRVLGPRWNASTCRPGRAVTLSLGYGKARRLNGVVASFDVHNEPLTIPGWRECYGERDVMAADIGITILPNVKDHP